MADETYAEPDTSTPGLTVVWSDEHGHCILHAPSRLMIAKAFDRRETAIVAADRMDGILPWAATAAKLREAPQAVVAEVADVVWDFGGTFMAHPAPQDGGAK